MILLGYVWINVTTLTWSSVTRPFLKPQMPCLFSGIVENQIWQHFFGSLIYFERGYNLWSPFEFHDFRPTWSQAHDEAKFVYNGCFFLTYNRTLIIHRSYVIMCQNKMLTLKKITNFHTHAFLGLLLRKIGRKKSEWH